MQDEINEKSVNLAVRVSSITADEVRKALQKVTAEIGGGAKQVQRSITGKPGEMKHGKQTMRELSRHNAGLSSIELKDPNLRLLNQTMKQNGVDFAPVKDGKGKYTLFFKGRDADALTHAFSQYTAKVTGRERKPSIAAALAAMKEAAAKLNVGRDKVKNVDKGAR
jgi:hypothetical protein